MPPAKKRAPAKKTAAAPKRGRATAGGATPPSPPAKKTPAERGKQTTAAPERGKATTPPPSPPAAGARPIGTKDKPGVLAKVAQPKPGADYHRAVLAEFLGALILALLGGILSPRKRADGTPTWVHLIVQVTAVAGVYFILALLSATEKLGKIAAAFGLLVLLGVLLNSADAVRKVAAIFAPAKAPAAQPPAAGSTQPSGAGG